MIFNATLFALVSSGLITLGNAFIPFALIGLHLHLSLSRSFIAEVRALALVSLIGLTSHLLLSVSGVLIFNGTPYWLVLLCLVFATTVNHSLRWLSNVRYARLLAGLILAPAVYLVAAHFGAVRFGLPLVTTYLLLGATWLFLPMIFIRLSTRRGQDYA